jgi:hypothetical protein
MQSLAGIGTDRSSTNAKMRRIRSDVVTRITRLLIIKNIV